MLWKGSNPEIFGITEDYEIGGLEDFSQIGAYAEKIRPDFAFIGPEDPLGLGVVDMLMARDIPAVGPQQTVARLESSKSFTRNLLGKYKISGNPRFQIFSSIDGVEDFMKELGGNW